MRPVLRDNQQMSVRDAITVHHEADPFTRERFAELPSDAVPHPHQVSREVFSHVREVIDVLTRDDHAFAGRGRLDAHEAKASIVRIHHACSRSPRNDLAKNAGR